VTSKPGVDLDRLHPIVQDALPRMEAARLEALDSLLDTQLVVTAGAEGEPGDAQHGPRSLHYVANCPDRTHGLAVDLRTKDFAEAFRAALVRTLGPGWDVVVEKDHVHVERDLRRAPLRTPKEGV
jgi:hypothetical protein